MAWVDVAKWRSSIRSEAEIATYSSKWDVSELKNRIHNVNRLDHGLYTYVAFIFIHTIIFTSPFQLPVSAANSCSIYRVVVPELSINRFGEELRGKSVFKKNESSLSVICKKLLPFAQLLPSQITKLIWIVARFDRSVEIKLSKNGLRCRRTHDNREKFLSDRKVNRQQEIELGCSFLLAHIPGLHLISELID